MMSSSFAEFLFQLLDHGAHIAVGLAQVLNGFACVEHGGMVLVAALHADDGEARLGDLLGEVHGELACLHYLALARCVLDGVDREVKVVADNFLDVVDGDLAYAALDILVDHLFREVEGDLLAVQCALCNERDEGTLQLTHVSINIVRDVFDHVIGQFDTFVLCLLEKYLLAGFHIGSLQVGAKTPFKTAEKAGFETLQFAGSLVRGDDNLAVVLMQVIEDMEEGFLCLLGFARPELDVVDDEHIDEFIEVYEVVGVAGAASFGELLHELLAGDIKNSLVGMQLFGLYTDGVGEVGLAEADVAMEQQGVEAGGARFLGNGVTGRASQAVAFALNEVLQCVVGRKLRVDALLVEPRDDERIGYLALVLLSSADGHIHQRVAGRLTAVRRQGGHDGRGAYALVHHHAVAQHARRTELHTDDALQEVYIMFFKIFIKKLARHLHDERAAIELQRHYGDKPCVESPPIFRTEGIFYHFKAFRPHSLIIFLNHCRYIMGHSVCYFQ